MRKALTPNEIRQKIIAAKILRLSAVGFALCGVLLFIFSFLKADDFLTQFQDPLAFAFFGMPFIPAFVLSLIAYMLEKTISKNIENALQLREERQKGQK